MMNSDPYTTTLLAKQETMLTANIEIQPSPHPVIIDLGYLTRNDIINE